MDVVGKNGGEEKSLNLPDFEVVELANLSSTNPFFTQMDKISLFCPFLYCLIHYISLELRKKSKKCV